MKKKTKKAKSLPVQTAQAVCGADEHGDPIPRHKEYIILKTTTQELIVTAHEQNATVLDLKTSCVSKIPFKIEAV
jgi:hypothetical protein